MIIRLAEPKDWKELAVLRALLSDALIDNSVSENAHTALGFEIVGRCIRFRKTLQ